jgi:hypothetical protein
MALPQAPERLHVESLPDRGAVGHKFVFIYFQRIWKVIGGRSATPLVHSLEHRAFNMTHTLRL